MLEPGGEPDLALEPLRAERRGQLRMQDLEGDGAVVPNVPGEVDRGHAAAPELALEAVAVAQGGLERVTVVGQMGARAGIALRATRREPMKPASLVKGSGRRSRGLAAEARRQTAPRSPLQALGRIFQRSHPSMRHIQGVHPETMTLPRTFDLSRNAGVANS